LLLSLHLLYTGFAATYFEEKNTRYSFAMQWTMFQFGMGSSALLSLMLPVKVNLIIVGVIFLIAVPLHLIAICCFVPLVHKVYEMPTFFVDE